MASYTWADFGLISVFNDVNIWFAHLATVLTPNASTHGEAATCTLRVLRCTKSTAVDVYKNHFQRPDSLCCSQQGKKKKKKRGLKKKEEERRRSSIPNQYCHSSDISKYSQTQNRCSIFTSSPKKKPGAIGATKPCTDALGSWVPFFLIKSDETMYLNNWRHPTIAPLM